jgi:hypothetical protein
MAFSKEKHQCWLIQKKYVKTIGHFSESFVGGCSRTEAIFLSVQCILNQKVLF